MVKADFSDLPQYLVNAGPHPIYEDARWWQIAFDFGWVMVSISETPFTAGVEMRIWGHRESRLLRRITPLIAVNELRKILERSAA